MTAAAAQGTGVGWTAPGPGYWELETTHHGLRPLSPIVADAYVRGFEAGATAMVERYGLPLTRIRAALVNGCFYVRPEGIGQGDEPRPPPPRFLMKLIVRLHPELRRRARTAALVWRERRWRTEVDQWFGRDRAVQLARNLELQRVDPATLDDAGLAAHLTVCLDQFEDGIRRNLDTHGGDLMPVGDLLAHGERWRLDHASVAALLVGSSPATVETARLLHPVAQALQAADRTPTSVDDLRALGPEAAVAVDTWLEQHAWRLVTSDDIDRPTLAELPSLHLRALLAAAAPAATETGPGPVDLATVRARVPDDQWALLDTLVEEARYGNRQREDIRGLCWNWPGGLLRRALLEAGRRLVAIGRLHDAEHAAELTPAEADALLRGGLRGGTGPDADELAARATGRDRIEATPPPRTLGVPEAPPPLDALPPALARATRAMMTMLTADATVAQTRELQGVGIAGSCYRGRACVATDAGAALEQLQPGDVLVARFTGPSFAAILPLLGALVTEEGGPLCHAAIVAREFGLPAVVGVMGAMTTITHGSTVEVDPGTGTVHVA